MKILREPVVLEFEFKGKMHKCTPDFSVNGKLIEIKGDVFFENGDPSKKMIYPFKSKRKNMTPEKYKELNDFAEAKHQFMLSKGVLFMTYKNIKDMRTYVNDTYGRNYVKAFKLVKIKS